MTLTLSSIRFDVLKCIMRVLTGDALEIMGCMKGHEDRKCFFRINSTF